MKLDADTTSRIRADIEDGWHLRAHIHNHNFFPDHDVVASPSPSAPDRDFAARFRDDLGLLELRVTNGFETMRVPTDELDAVADLEPSQQQ